MLHYAWTIRKPGDKDIRHVTTMAELQEYLRVLGLPGVAPPAWVTMEPNISDSGKYTHGSGSMDEWSLTWTRVDGETEVID